MKRCNRQPGAFKAECLASAEHIASRARSAGKPLAIFMSGGIDSEIVARSFRELKIEFTAVSFAFPHDKSRHDIRWAETYCRMHSLPHKIIEFDPLGFLRDEAIHMAEHFSCPDVYPLFEIKRLMMIPDFFTVVGNGEPTVQFSVERDRVEFSESASDFIVRKWVEESKVETVESFFKTTSELYVSFLLDPLTQIWASHAKSLRFEQMTWWKFYLYKRHWPDLRRRQKWTGYEQIAGAYFELENEIKKRFSYQSEFHFEGYRDFLLDYGVAPSLK